jgi:hypothetical protein
VSEGAAQRQAVAAGRHLGFMQMTAAYFACASSSCSSPLVTGVVSRVFGFTGSYGFAWGALLATGRLPSALERRYPPARERVSVIEFRRQRVDF